MMGQAFIFNIICRSLALRCAGNSLEREQAEIESKASKLFLSPQQGFCCCTAEIPQLRAAPRLAEGEITALCMLSEAVSSPLLCGWFSHPQNGSIIQSQTPIHTTLTQLTQPDT